MGDPMATLGSGPVLCDSAMGTQLQLAGLGPGDCAEAWNLDHADRVLAIHRACVQAGSRCLITNTFCGSRHALSLHGEGGRTTAINRRGAELAREALGSRGLVLGDMGPLGNDLTAAGGMKPRELRSMLREQAAALLAGGADAILCETQLAPDEAETALLAAREAGAGCVILSFAFDRQANGFRTMCGLAPHEAAERAEAWGADVIGANCGADMLTDDYIALTAVLRAACGRPLMIQPNAGRPERVNGSIVYHETPEKMAAGVPDLLAAGASVIGGCCGTTPEHIRLFSRHLANSD